jgi:hypothetical protein
MYVKQAQNLNVNSLCGLFSITCWKKNWSCSPSCSSCYCMPETEDHHLLTKCNFTEALCQAIAPRFNLPQYNAITSLGGPVDWVIYLSASGVGLLKEKSWAYCSSSGGIFGKKEIGGFFCNKEYLLFSRWRLPGILKLCRQDHPVWSELGGSPSGCFVLLCAFPMFELALAAGRQSWWLRLLGLAVLCCRPYFSELPAAAQCFGFLRRLSSFLFCWCS